VHTDTENVRTSFNGMSQRAHTVDPECSGTNDGRLRARSSE
jgi:hypothetical protein